MVARVSDPSVPWVLKKERVDVFFQEFLLRTRHLVKQSSRNTASAFSLLTPNLSPRSLMMYGQSSSTGDRTLPFSREPGWDTISENLINISGYHLTARNRTTDIHGGVGLYIKSTIEFRSLHYLNDPAFETLWTWLRPPRLPRGISCLIASTIYHPVQIVNDRASAFKYRSPLSFGHL